MIEKSSKEVTTGDWVLTLFIAAIPIVGFIMLFVWAFGDGTNDSKANWAKATLIWFVIIVGLYTTLFLIFGAAFLANIS